MKISSSNGQSYSERLDKVRTEKDLSDIFDDMIDRVPMGQKLFGHLNPVHTGGPMQVSVAFAEAHAKGYPYPIDGSIRREVFSRRGGMYFGIMHLLGYPADYSRPIYRFADFNAGWYASRNAAFQNAVSRASAIPLALDGDLIDFGSDKPGSTELAVRTLGKRLNMSDSAIRRALEKATRPALPTPTCIRRSTRWRAASCRVRCCRVSSWRAENHPQADHCLVRQAGGRTPPALYGARRRIMT